MAQVAASAGAVEGNPPQEGEAPVAARGVIPHAPLPGVPESLLKEPMTPGQVAEAIASADPDLVYLWGQGKGLPLEIQARFATLGFTEMDVFSKLADSAAEVRVIAQTELGLRDDLGIRGRAIVGRILTCWEAAGKRLSRKHLEDADQRAVDLPRRLPAQEHDEMLNAFEDAHEEKEDADTPAKLYTDGKVAQIEKGKLVAERLSDVLSVPEATDDDWNGAVVKSDGTFKLTKTPKGEVRLPLTTEELRYRIDLLTTAWEMIRLKFPNNAILIGLDAKVWQDHIRFILSDKVYGKRVKTAEGKSYAPAWAQVLELEFQIRHRAYKRASQKKITLKRALEEARTDDKLLQEFFHGPVSLEAGAAAARDVLASSGAASSTTLPPTHALSYVETTHTGDPPGKLKTKGGKPKGIKGGKGKKKGKGKGKNKVAPKAGPKAKAEPKKRKLTVLCMQKNKCIKFNLGACVDKKCPYGHQCAVCGDDACAAYWHDE